MRALCITLLSVGCNEIFGLPTAECQMAIKTAAACIEAAQASGTLECKIYLCRASEICPCDKISAMKYCAAEVKP